MKAPESDPEQFQMDLMGHLRELRKRIIYSLLVVTVGSIFAYMYAPQIFAVLCQPYYEAFENSPLIGTSPAEALLLKFKVSLAAGTLFTSPFLFYQLWLFITPGLYDSERKLILPFVACSTLLFVGGAAFCYKLVLPYSFAFFKDEYTSIGVTPNIKIGEQLSMTLTVLLGFGAVFEMPLLAFFLARAGVIDHRFLLRWFRHAVVVIFFIAAALTPPDVVTQFLMAGPLLGLYLLSIGVAWWVSPRIEPEPDITDLPQAGPPPAGA